MQWVWKSLQFMLTCCNRAWVLAYNSIALLSTATPDNSRSEWILLISGRLHVYLSKFETLVIIYGQGYLSGAKWTCRVARVSQITGDGWYSTGDTTLSRVTHHCGGSISDDSGLCMPKPAEIQRRISYARNRPSQCLLTLSADPYFDSDHC